jgi:outer membrane lipoprotein-sorting protein
MYRHVGLAIPRVVAAALAVALATFSSGARADEVAKIDEALNRWKTLDCDYHIATKKPGSKPAMLKLRMRMRQRDNHNQQIIDIADPADMKGTKVLILAPTKMYIYLPAYQKIRRIASHVTEQGFLGTALSQRELSLTRYAAYYTGKKLSDDGKIVKVLLTAKNDEAPYPKIELKVEKKRWLPLEIKYFNDKGAHIKSEERSDYKCKGNICTPGVQTVSDLSSKVTSVLQLKEYKIDANLPDSIFSKRYLQK